MATPEVDILELGNAGRRLRPTRPAGNPPQDVVAVVLVPARGICTLPASSTGTSHARTNNEFVFLDTASWDMSLSIPSVPAIPPYSHRRNSSVGTSRLSTEWHWPRMLGNVCSIYACSSGRSGNVSRRKDRMCRSSERVSRPVFSLLRNVVVDVSPGGTAFARG